MKADFLDDTTDPGLGLRGLTSISTQFVRHSELCRPGYWNVWIRREPLEWIGLPIADNYFDAVVDDFGNLVRVP